MVGTPGFRTTLQLLQHPHQCHGHGIRRGGTEDNILCCTHFFPGDQAVDQVTQPGVAAFEREQRSQAYDQVARMALANMISDGDQSTQAFIPRRRDHIFIDGDIKTILVELIGDAPHQGRIRLTTGLQTGIDPFTMRHHRRRLDLHRCRQRRHDDGRWRLLTQALRINAESRLNDQLGIATPMH